MHSNRLIAFAFALMSSLGLAAQSSGESRDKSALLDQRKRLADLYEGMTSEQVLKKLGRPDKVRRVPDNGVLDGVRYGREDALEVERWYYGATVKGMFAQVGIVSLDRKGKVVAARSPDVYSTPWAVRERVLPKDDRAVQTPSMMRCNIGSVKYVSSEKFEVKGIGTVRAGPRLKMTVTLKNAGPRAFELKHDAARGIGVFLLVELYDADGVLLFRDDYLRYHSAVSFDPEEWPILSVPAGREKSEKMVFRPDEEFGPLPPGKYSLRVYFPLEKKYYPSNLVRFEWKKAKRSRVRGRGLLRSLRGDSECGQILFRRLG